MGSRVGFPPDAAITTSRRNLEAQETYLNASSRQSKADSLDIVELVMAFEEAFGLDIPDEDAEKIKTVKDAVDYIESKSKK